MQNLGGQTQSIMVFSELAYSLGAGPTPRVGATTGCSMDREGSIIP